MLTHRAWWLFLTLLGMLFAGVRMGAPLVAGVALVVLVWFCWEWLRFVICVRVAVPAMLVDREVGDERGRVTTLWAGRTFEVRVALRAIRRPGVEFAAADDAVPFGLEPAGGEASARGPLAPGRPLTLGYRVRCTAAGLARFEGVNVRVADLQGLFYHVAFVRAPVVFPVLPVLADRRATLAATKRVNELPPPGVHRFRRPGSGSELLDLRDYLPGDPPKTIAWKVSARRDRLITKEFESEVPIRCTLFVDTSSSVRVPALAPPAGDGGPWRSVRALDRLVEIAAGVVQANTARRDLTVVCLFDESASEVIRPGRTGPRLTQMLHRLAGAAALDPTAARTDPERLLPLATAFAREVYPDLMAQDVNAVPWWVKWFAAYPAGSRTRPGWLRRVHRTRLRVLLAGTLGVPVFTLLTYAAAVAYVVFAHKPQELIAKTIARGLVLTVALSALSTAASVGWFACVSLFSLRARRFQDWRKRLAALLALRYGAGPGGLSALLEDDDQLSLHLQHFLGEHRVPYSLPLYGADGRYLFGAVGKVPVLAKALVRAVGRGRDNELFVLLADVLEIDQNLEPLLRAVRVALGRHHQVLLVCAWPPAVALPGWPAAKPAAPPAPGTKPLPPELADLATRRLHVAYRRARLTFGRLGVQIVCAASDEPVALILDRIERMRRLRRVH
jgi:uncharacterized protein (DUF58 family)